MIYKPDIGLHGLAEVKVDSEALRHEPSLTLCSLPVFAEWAGPVSKQVFAEIAATSAFQRLACRAARDPSVSVRISVYVVWLEAGDFPSHRPDWHIDRIGALHRQGHLELVDLRDPLSFPSFVLSSIFLTESSDALQIDSPSTEFLLATFEGTSPELWADMQAMHLDIDRWLERNPNPRVLKAGDRSVVSFSTRTVHRPGQAVMGGWRYLMRLGLYTTLEPCSPYPDHLVFFNPVWSSLTGAPSFRRVGDTHAVAEPAKRSVSLVTEEGRAAASDFLERNSFRRGNNFSTSEMRALVKNAARQGEKQLRAGDA